MENFIEQGVDCILVDLLDSEGLKPTIEKASAVGIPTITMAGKVDVDTTIRFITTENTRINRNDRQDDWRRGQGRTALRQ